MLTKKLLVICFTAFTWVLLLTGCSEKTADSSSSTEPESTESETTESSEQIDKDSIETVHAVTDTSRSYETVEDIIPYADVMVKGEVIETDGLVTSEGTVLSLVKVKVEEDYLGVIPSGSEVYFIELGGIVPTSEMPEQAPKDFEQPVVEEKEYTEVIYNGTPVTEVGETVLYFGSPNEDDFYNLNIGETYYNLIGGDYSTFVLDEETNQFVRPIDEIGATATPIVIDNTDEALNAIALMK